jgi:hypothetical protein
MLPVASPTRRRDAPIAFDPHRSPNVAQTLLSAILNPHRFPNNQ